MVSGMKSREFRRAVCERLTFQACHAVAVGHNDCASTICCEKALQVVGPKRYSKRPRECRKPK